MGMLRLSSSKIVGQGRILLSHTCGSIRREKVPFAEKAFCSDVTKNQIPLQLTQILDSEIAAKKEKILNNPIPEFPFVVKDDLRKKVTMSRDFNGERISVIVDYADNDYLSMDVTIRKQDRKMLTLWTTDNRHGETSINMLFFEDDYLGVDFNMIEPEDLKLEDGLKEYLAARGFKKDYYALLREYMINHKRKLRLHALQKIRKFVTEDY